MNECAYLFQRGQKEKISSNFLENSRERQKAWMHTMAPLAPSRGHSQGQRIDQRRWTNVHRWQSTGSKLSLRAGRRSPAGRPMNSNLQPYCRRCWSRRWSSGFQSAKSRLETRYLERKATGCRGKRIFRWSNWNDSERLVCFLLLVRLQFSMIIIHNYAKKSIWQCRFLQRNQLQFR